MRTHGPAGAAAFTLSLLAAGALLVSVANRPDQPAPGQQRPAVLADPQDRKLTDYSFRHGALGSDRPAIAIDAEDSRLTDYGFRLKQRGS